MAEETPRGVFVIDGGEYPFPELGDGFTMDEAMIFYDWTGFAIEDLMVDDEDADDAEEKERRARSPKVFAALMHIAYARSHPKATEKSIREIVKRTDFVAALKNFGEQETEEESPLASTTEPGPSSPNGSVTSPESSGDSSTSDTERPDGLHAITGTTRSAT